VTGLARRRAAALLTRNADAFARIGYREGDRPGPLSVRLEPPDGRQPLLLRMAPQGRIFGGTYGLEISTLDPVLPASRGLAARGRGVVRLRGFAFRARGGDAIGRDLAKRLGADGGLVDALRDVHFERIRIEPDGRPVIRHMGGSLVWILFPPLLRQIPLLESQAQASAGALEEFARVGAYGPGMPGPAEHDVAYPPLP
jgi:hypothetical protein